MKVSITAIQRGSKMNRRFYVKKKKPDPSPQRAVRHFKADPLVRGMDYTLICVSIPVSELITLDEFAESVSMARSHVLRMAVREMIKERKG